MLIKIPVIHIHINMCGKYDIRYKVYVIYMHYIVQYSRVLIDRTNPVSTQIDSTFNEFFTVSKLDNFEFSSACQLQKYIFLIFRKE